jgi:hypothetical protein
LHIEKKLIFENFMAGFNVNAFNRFAGIISTGKFFPLFAVIL